jgi:hypothetical protein
MEIPKAVIKWVSIPIALIVFGMMFYQCFGR